MGRDSDHQPTENKVKSGKVLQETLPGVQEGIFAAREGLPVVRMTFRNAQEGLPEMRIAFRNVQE